MDAPRGSLLALGVAMMLSAGPAAAQTSPPPRPVPFPGSTPPPATVPAKPAVPDAPTTPTGGQTAGTADPRLAGVVMYPGAELLTSFDGGRGQTVFLFGTNMPYSDVVGFYRQQMRSSGSEIFRAPAMHQFDLGPFRTDSMAQRPSVVVKDYTWMDSPGYLHVSGTAEKRYRTVIQIVPLVR